MDVSKYNLDGEKITIVVDSEKELEPFEFKVQPILESALFGPANQSPDPRTALAATAVIGWNFVSGTDPVPCDEENKKKYLAKFASYLVKTVNGQAPKKRTNLVTAIVDFALNPESFLKN